MLAVGPVLRAGLGKRRAGDCRRARGGKSAFGAIWKSHESVKNRSKHARVTYARVRASPAMPPHREGCLGRGCSMSAPGSKAKRSSSSVKGRPSSLSIPSNILRSASLSSWRAASRSGVSGVDGSLGANMALNAAAVTKLPLPRSVLLFPARTTTCSAYAIRPRGCARPCRSAPRSRTSCGRRQDFTRPTQRAVHRLGPSVGRLPPLRRLKTSWPLLSRIRNPIVRGGNAELTNWSRNGFRARAPFSSSACLKG